MSLSSLDTGIAGSGSGSLGASLNKMGLDTLVVSSFVLGQVRPFIVKVTL